jgi:hypothetical protein
VATGQPVLHQRAGRWRRATAFRARAGDVVVASGVPILFLDESTATRARNDQLRLERPPAELVEQAANLPIEEDRPAPGPLSIWLGSFVGAVVVSAATTVTALGLGRQLPRLEWFVAAVLVLQTVYAFPLHALLRWWSASFLRTSGGRTGG